MSSVLPPAGQPEYLGDAPTGDAPDGGSRRATFIAVAVLAVVAIAAVGGWAAASWTSSGSQPATALPATTIAYLSLDLDPSADQKLEALRIIEKFPALDEKLGLDTGDDLRRWIFDRSGLGSCDTVDYETHVAPWIGERAAVALLPSGQGGGEPAVVMALQVTDQDAASDGLDRMADCAAAEGGGTGGGGEPGHAFTEDYVLIAETPAVADAAVAQTADGRLADDATFRRWTSAAGEPGILTLYAAPTAPAALLNLVDARRADGPWSTYDEPDSSGGHEELPPGSLDPDLDPDLDPGRLGRLTEGFAGMAAVLRFAGGTVEAEFAAGGLPEAVAPGSDAVAGATPLPASTGAVVSFAVPDGWLGRTLESMSAAGMPVDRMLADAEAESGLSLPEDLEALLGDSFSLVVDSQMSAGPAIAGGVPGPLPVGVRIEGNPAEIMPAVEKLRAGLGPAAAMVVVEPGDGAVALGLGEEYVGRLAGQGSLGEDATFLATVPEAERVGGVLYANFGAGDDWVERLVEVFAPRSQGPPSAEVRENLAALEALGISTWADGDVQRGLLRLTTD